MRTTDFPLENPRTQKSQLSIHKHVGNNYKIMINHSIIAL